MCQKFTGTPQLTDMQFDKLLARLFLLVTMKCWISKKETGMILCLQSVTNYKSYQTLKEIS
jgi:hypothetical protein